MCADTQFFSLASPFSKFILQSYSAHVQFHECAGRTMGAEQLGSHYLLTLNLTLPGKLPVFSPASMPLNKSRLESVRSEGFWLDIVEILVPKELLP